MGTITDGVRFEPAMFGQPFVLMGLPNPSAEEIAAVQERPIKVGLYRANEHVAFLLLHMHGLNDADGWGDAPFSAMLAHPDARKLPHREPAAGWTITFALVDTNTNVLRALRTGTVTPEFSALMEDMIDEQIQNGGMFERGGQAAAINAAYARFPRCGDMAGSADIVEPFGAKFEDARRQRTGTRFQRSAG
jgi:hypothetical protein